MPKLFVLDTSVLLFDHNAISNFEDNDIVIPISVLEELDNFKLGNQTINFEARNVIRFLDKISGTEDLDKWIDLGEDKGNLKIVMSCKPASVDAEKIYGDGKIDHKIINVALCLKEEIKDTKVILVSKDINLRLKAKALGLLAEDYKTGKVKDIRLKEGYPSIEDIDATVIKNLYQKNSITEHGILAGEKVANGYYVLNNCSQSVLARYDMKSDTIRRIEKSYAYGIRPRNAEQTFALDALLNTDIRLIALEGMAGTGKTLLALAAALEQKNMYQQIILARPIVPLSNKEIGFLPGDVVEKISPYMQPLYDNLKFIKSQFKGTERKYKVLEELEENGDLELIALNFVRGRSLANVMFIVDEAQNLTPHEIKTIISRAGEDTKIVFTGDIYQIDTPYLDEHSNGLSYMIDRLRGNPLFAHIKLHKGERSELANLANTML
jgi:PhoH-like ATPase